MTLVGAMGGVGGGAATRFVQRQRLGRTGVAPAATNEETTVIQGKVWQVVKPSVGIPVVLGAVAVGWFAVHVALLTQAI
jgi:hypothetical protein